ncbi:cyclin-dependent kinase inhibitor 1B [Austrofundulus limnaeus]|uniref:Cyclin-dependent kinase inhibitor 1B n=1 Tax=Austrofundulus limnaeus TaxID=52670 RepID=A0A2I4CFI0_AUSLI|nr:PREDICTED: cyclin-dependent kinase inhibitor 1B-like [Austrofundulus limnaeus]XP_013878751.1 PREDICTED: cyclin-dependent kinase inhibitor 1B-like [Austrofundulus limnaeus]
MTTGRCGLPKESVFFGGGKNMSGVRLSNGSPTLERTDSRVAEHPKPSACRNLFGSVDHGQLSKDFNAHMREQEAAAAAKWDFDFVNDTPLADNRARFQWELVRSSELPGFYRRPPRRDTGGRSGNNAVDLNGNHRCVLVASSEDTGRSDGQTDCTGPRKRPACHEPSPQRKRSHSSSSGPGEVSSGLSVEHTPRKLSPNRQT